MGKKNDPDGLLRKQKFELGKTPGRRSGGGSRESATRRRYGENFQNSQFRGVSYDRREGRKKRWIAKVAKAKVHHLCETEDEAAHVVNLVHQVTYPERFLAKGYPNDTGLYSLSVSYDDTGRPAQWVNSPRDPDGFFLYIDPADTGRVGRRIAWFDAGEKSFPRTPYLYTGGGRIRVGWMTVDEFLTGYRCLPEDGDHRNARRANLLKVEPSEDYRRFSGEAGE